LPNYAKPNNCGKNKTIAGKKVITNKTINAGTKNFHTSVIALLKGITTKAGAA